MSKKKEKGKKKRDLDRYPALNQRLNAKTRFEVLDMDYLKKLDDAQLKYLNQFMAEYVSGAFKKNEDGSYSDENFHETVEERRECYTRNNTRNRCGLTVSNATGQTYRCEDISSFMDSLTDVESMLEGVNAFSDIVQDKYDGNYEDLEMDILQEMIDDYRRCIDPKTSSDKKMAESNYGKMLFSKFKNVKLVNES
jgi:uncharacterized protein YkvS